MDIDLNAKNLRRTLVERFGIRHITSQIEQGALTCASDDAW